MLASIYPRMAGPSPNWKLKPSLFVCQTVNTLLTLEGPYNWNQPPQFVLCSYISCGLICLQQWMYLLHSGLPVSDSLLFKIRFLVRLLQFTPVRCFLHYGFHEVPWLYQFLHCSLQVWKYSFYQFLSLILSNPLVQNCWLLALLLWILSLCQSCLRPQALVQN